MTALFIVCSILLIALILCIRIIIVSQKKITKLEAYASEFLSDMTLTRERIDAAMQVMNNMKLKKAFESDDEVGDAFKIIYDCFKYIANVEEKIDQTNGETKK